MAITLVGTNSVTTFSGLRTFNLAQTPAAGDFLILTFAGDNGGNPGRFVNSVSHGGFTTFTQVATMSAPNAEHSQSEIWMGANASGAGGLALTVSATRSTDIYTATVAEFSGLTSTQDGTPTTSLGQIVPGVGPFTTTYTTANATDLLVAVTSVLVPGLNAYNGTWTSFQQQPIGGDASGDAESWSVYNITSTAGSYGTNWQWSGSACSFTTCVIALQAAGTSPGGIMPLIGLHESPVSEPMEGTLLTRL